MPEELNPFSHLVYEIRILGRVNPELKDWFGGLELRTFTIRDGMVVTRLCGVIEDQAALFGVVNRIRDLGMRLISINPIDPESKGPEVRMEGERNER